jgi:hypothetical protein
MADTKNVEQRFNDYLPDCPPQNETEASLDALRTGLYAGWELVFRLPKPLLNLLIKVDDKN